MKNNTGFIDLRVSYNSIPRIQVWEDMKEIGILEQMIIAKEDLYTENKASKI